MNAPAGYHVVALRQVQSLNKVFEQAAVHFFVVHKPCRFAFAPVADALSQSSAQTKKIQSASKSISASFVILKMCAS